MKFKIYYLVLFLIGLSLNCNSQHNYFDNQLRDLCDNLNIYSPIKPSITIEVIQVQNRIPVYRSINGKNRLVSYIYEPDPIYRLNYISNRPILRDPFYRFLYDY